MEKIVNQGAETKNLGENSELPFEWVKKSINTLKNDIEKQKKMLKWYNGYFKIEIPDERQSAIEYDLEEICMRQWCTVDEVLELNNISVEQLKPGKIITIPIISWKNNEEPNTHWEEISPEKEVDWGTIKSKSKEGNRLVEDINKKHFSDTSLIFDKKDSRMYILKEWKILYSTIFLSGENNTTDVMNFPGMTEDFDKNTNPDFMITPSWKFPVSLNASGERGYGTSFDYLKWIYADGALHTPSKREYSMDVDRMKTPEITDNNTTWWCMVMTPEALEVIKKHYQENKTYAYVMPLHGKLEDYLQID